MKQVSYKVLPSPKEPVCILDPGIPLSDYRKIDLSTANGELEKVDLTDPEACGAYIEQFLSENRGKVAYGGYLERRNLYTDKPAFFSANSPRNIHLGVDFWAEAGTEVLTPLDGTVHSLKNNSTKGDYGPTVILQHNRDNNAWYTLYGHLSLETLDYLEVGQLLKAGELVGTLGTTDINVNYAPHLHFQLIMDIGSYEGDYPGVGSADELDYYQNNCPDPYFLLGM